MEEKKLVTGIILAGGKSSRMGYDKGLAILNGKKMIEHIYEALLKVTDQVIIIANNNSYDYLGLPVFEDMYKNKGPIGGIYTGLFHSTTEKNFIVACDMPFITPSLFMNLLEYGDKNQIVVPSVSGNLEPLCGFYKREILEQVKELIEMDILPVHKVIAFFDHYVLINDKELDEENVFANINKPEDLQLYEGGQFKDSII